MKSDVPMEPMFVSLNPLPHKDNNNHHIVLENTRGLVGFFPQIGRLYEPTLLIFPSYKQRSTTPASSYQPELANCIKNICDQTSISESDLVRIGLIHLI